MSVTVENATLDHVLRFLEHGIRRKDAAECERAGFQPNHAIMKSFESSTFSRVMVADGVICALYGVSGSFVGRTGQPWLFTSPEVEKHKLSFLKIGHQTVKDMHALYEYLYNFVDAEYGGALRYAAALGFKIGEPKLVFNDAHPFCKIERRR